MNTEIDTELLSCSEMDDVCDCQHNIEPAELGEAIAALSTDQLVVLREQCLESVTRQNHILGLIKLRLGEPS